MEADQGRGEGGEGSSEPTPRLRGFLRRLAVDTTPLRVSRDYRLLWTGQLVSAIGTHITFVAVYYQVFLLTRSAAAVGFVGLAQLVPLLLTSIGGGPLVDSLDRRRLLLLIQWGLVGSSSILLLGAMLGTPPVGLIYGAVGLNAALVGLESPTRLAMIPRLMEREHVSSALALHQVLWNTGMIAGPALGGVLLGRFGLSYAYGADVASYGAAFAAVMLMRPLPPTRGEGGPRLNLRAIREGWSYLKGRRVLQSTFTADLIAMVLGNPRALFPILAVTQFHAGPETIGLLFSALAVGALLGATTAGWIRRVKRQGQAVLIAVALWGAAIALFGSVGDRLALALVLLAVAGGADVISAVFRSTILQLSVPDSLRGRLSGFNVAVVVGGPRLGDVRAGLMAQALTSTAAVVWGGVAVLAGVLLLNLLVPEFRRYRAGDPV